jgi:hypothetical protein
VGKTTIVMDVTGVLNKNINRISSKLVLDLGKIILDNCKLIYSHFLLDYIFLEKRLGNTIQ